MYQSNRITRCILIALMALTSVAAFAATGAGTVNVNTAGVEELQLLPRVGPSVAQRIVDFRDENGEFKALDDLLLVRGIGDKTLELLRPHISLSGATTLDQKVTVPRPEAGQSEKSDE